MKRRYQQPSRALATALICALSACAWDQQGEQPAEGRSAEQESSICSHTAIAADHPDAFCVRTRSGTGPVTPEGAYSYTIRIGPTPRGTVTVDAGYGASTHSADFDVSEDAFAALVASFSTVDLDGAMAVEEIPIGGSPVGLAVVVEGVPSTFEDWMASPWEGRKQEYASRVRALVPETVWAELSAASDRTLRY